MKAQRGQVVILFVLLVMSVAVTLIVSGAAGEVARTVKVEATTRLALAQAKEALIGRAVMDDQRPGSLPCPDTNDDGTAELFVGNQCPSYIGRLPWRTLGLPDLRDESGERLWYALSPRFRDDNSVQINSDTKGSLTVYSVTATSCITAACISAVPMNKNFSAGTPAANTDVVAVVFAPGAALATQIRDATAAACTTTGTTIARSLCATNYLETWFTVANATAPDPATAIASYVIAPRTTTFNDRLAPLRTAELMPVVEKRVAAEVTDALESYFRQTQAGLANGCAVGCYPWPDSRTAGVVGTPPDGTSDTGTNRGRIPVVALPYAWSKNISGITRALLGIVTTSTAHGFTTGQQIYLKGIVGMTELNNRFVTVTAIDATHFSINVSTLVYTAYASGGVAGPAFTNVATYQTPTLPDYFQNNNWDRVMYYGVGQNALQNAGLIPTACTTCTAPPPPLGSLSVNGQSGYAVVVITPGSTNANRPSTNWSDYIDDAGNRDANDTFFTPVSRALDRDRLYKIADLAPPASCSPNAQALIANAPCHTTGNSVKAICQQAVNNLAACTQCNTAANTMIQPPCRNTLNPGQCQTAVSQLQSCNG